MLARRDASENGRMRSCWAGRLDGDDSSAYLQNTLTLDLSRWRVFLVWCARVFYWLLCVVRCWNGFFLLLFCASVKMMSHATRDDTIIRVIYSYAFYEELHAFYDSV